MESDVLREQLVAAGIEVFVSTIGFIPRDKVSEHTNFLQDFKIIDDDLTAFVLEVEKTFALNSDRGGWQYVETIGQIADLIIDFREHPEKYPARPPNRLASPITWLCQKLRLTSTGGKKTK